MMPNYTTPAKAGAYGRKWVPAFAGKDYQGGHAMTLLPKPAHQRPNSSSCRDADK